MTQESAYPNNIKEDYSKYFKINSNRKLNKIIHNNKAYPGQRKVVEETALTESDLASIFAESSANSTEE